MANKIKFLKPVDFNGQAITNFNVDQVPALNSKFNQKQDKITSTNKLDYSLIDNKPTIPDAVSVSETGTATKEAKYITIGDRE